ncbi:cuticular protein 49Af [Glossina fuscipes fuscipes]
MASIAYAKDIQLMSQEIIVQQNGRHHYHYEQNDGSKVTQDGYQKHVEAEHDGQAMEGKFSFPADDGKLYTVTYTADENGFRAYGENLPTPPPTPEAILKALKYIGEHAYHTSETH